MNQAQDFGSKIIRIYLLGATTLLAFYTMTFHAGILFTENKMLERRLSITAPYHVQQFQTGAKGVIYVDPLLTLYENHNLLPSHIQNKVLPGWTGSQHLILDDELEYQLIAIPININNEQKVVYAIEDANPTEWDDTGFVLTEIILVLVAVILFLITTTYMVRAARRIASPFLQVARQLESDCVSNFERLSPSGERTRELNQILSALNAYRHRLAQHIDREQSFTRYVSHELRTPIMVIKGSVSNLRRNLSGSTAPTDKTNKATDKIMKAADQMQELTQTFLMLARDENLGNETTKVDDTFLTQLCGEHEDTIAANQIAFAWQLKAPFQSNAHPQLFKAVVHNLLKNAFACSVEGKVTLMVDENGIDVIDNGLGLDSKPRGYEGFGIGLVLVRDVCSKYGWDFSLENNESGEGCTASVSFNPKTQS